MGTSTCCKRTSNIVCCAKSDLRFQYGKRKSGWYWHIRARNGEIIAQGEGYKRSAKLLKLLHLLRTGCGGMSVTNLSPSGVALKHKRKLTGIGS